MACCPRILPQVGRLMASQDQSTSRSLLGACPWPGGRSLATAVPSVRATGRRLVCHWGVRGQDADDVAQEVFQAVSKHLDTFRRDRPGDTFRGWLRTHHAQQIARSLPPSGESTRSPGRDAAHRLLQQIPNEELPEDSATDLGSLYHRALELVRSEFEQRTWEAFWRAPWRARRSPSSPPTWASRLPPSARPNRAISTDSAGNRRICRRKPCRTTPPRWSAPSATRRHASSTFQVPWILLSKVEIGLRWRFPRWSGRPGGSPCRSRTRPPCAPPARHRKYRRRRR